MQSQSQIYANYHQVLNTLIAQHPDLDLKLTQTKFDDDLDILRAVYLKVTLKDQSMIEKSEKSLKPLTSLTNTGDFLPAKITYLTELKVSKMKESETSEEELENDLKDAQAKVEDCKKKQRVKTLAEAEMKLKELEFIKSVSYALLQAQWKINNQADEAEEGKNEQKDISIDVLMKEWNEKYDPITDIDEELKDVQSSVAKHREKNRPKQLKEDEEKLTLLLKIIAAQKPKPDTIFSDQEIQKELKILQDDLEVENIDEARKELKDKEQRRMGLLSKPKALGELDLRIKKLSRIIILFQELESFQQPNPIFFESPNIELD